MIPIPVLQPHSPIDDAVLIPIGSEQCYRQVAAAERQLNAFLKAVQALYGDGVADRAADDWIALAQSIQAPSVQGFPSWRYVTILASSRLAMDHFGHRPKDEGK